MKEIIIVIFLSFFITSCEIQYDGETRMVFTGRVIDESGSPISEADIEITVFGGGGVLYLQSDLISYGNTNENGNFTLVFPGPLNINQISVSIQKGNQGFLEKQITMDKSNFENYKLDLNEITLYKYESLTTLKLILNKTSTNKQLKNVKIEGKLYDSYVNLNSVPDNTGYIRTNYTVVKNQNIILKYTEVDYSNNGASTPYSVSIPVNNEGVTYTINY